VRLSWQVLVAVLSLAYPLAWYWGREAGLFSWLAGGMAVLWGVRALLQRTRGQRVLSWVLAAFFVLVLLFERQHAMYWYPVLVNLLMLALFGGSLLTGQSIVERLARMQHPDLPPRGVRYTRRVTQVWCCFFLFNIAVILALIASSSWRAWALYTGVIAYGLMALLFSIEWLYRRRVMRLDAQS
jgi:putative intracellular septation protein A